MEDVTSSVNARFIAERIEGRSRSSAVAVVDADKSRSPEAEAEAEETEEGGDDDGCVVAHLAITMAKSRKHAGQPTHSHTFTAQSAVSAGWLIMVYSSALHSSGLSSLSAQNAAVKVQRTTLGA